MGPKSAIEQGLKEMREREQTGQETPTLSQAGNRVSDVQTRVPVTGYLQKLVHELRAQAHEKAKRAAQLQALIDVLPRVLPADAEEALWHLLRGL